ncbi:MAG: 50S ribosomal protein L17 [Puniceicoccales bacterium]|jgi:large subunit ribosomal protein L17|nr:50S ribosomal protein L17 [Puniceicoccales bacterium]
MRHKKHPFKLGVKKEHRQALLAGLSAALFRHGSIRTTLAKAKALRQFAEKIITMACKAFRADLPEAKLHQRRMAVARVRDHGAVEMLFDTRVEEFLNRPGGYTRIYKLLPRRGDAAKMAIIELVAANDRGYKRRKHIRPYGNKQMGIAGYESFIGAGGSKDLGAIESSDSA